MIKGSATIQFGSGSVASAAGVDYENDVGIICMRSVSPGKIGRDFGEVDAEFVKNNAEVVIYFTNVESLDAHIRMLEQLRENMANHKEVEEDQL